MKLPIKINRREKHFLLIGGVAIAVIVLFELFSQYSVFMKNAQEVSDAKLLMLEKQLNRILSGDDLRKQADKIYNELRTAGVDVLLDDREVRPGVKFNDADLIGVPLRVVVGERGLKEGNVEIKRRTDKKATLITAGDAGRSAREILNELKQALEP